MPSWLIIVVGVVVLVLGIGASVVLSGRRRTGDGLASDLVALRARAHGLEHRLDAAATDDRSCAAGAVVEARRLLDSATATLSSARTHRSRSAAAEAARTLDLAAAEIDRIGDRCR